MIAKIDLVAVIAASFCNSLKLAACQPDIESQTTPKTVVAQFDPEASPPVVPLPNDLARDPATRLLAIPDVPGASPAQLEFNAYLRTLDGFPQASPVSASFSDAIDAASLKPSNQVTANIAGFGCLLQSRRPPDHCGQTPICRRMKPCVPWY